MEKKAVSGIMLTLILLGMLTLAFNAQPAKASGAIYIKADGSVEGTDKIQHDGDIYTFIDNIYDFIVVQRDNIIVDGAGYSIQGSGWGTGIDVVERRNVTIRNMEIKAFNNGIWFYDSSNNMLTGNNIVENMNLGISFSYSSNNKLIGNNVTYNVNGIGLWYSSNNNTLFENNVSNMSGGIGVMYSSNNTLSRNNITDNYYGIWLYDSSNNILSGNDVTGNKAIGILLTNSPNNSIFHNNLVNNIEQVLSQDSLNAWDDGYPSGGNYWSDYQGIDEKFGSDQDQPERDGIGDTPYIIDSNNQDRYPLMDPWIERKVGVQVGDWVKYGNFVAEWSSDDPSANPPSDYDFWKSIEWTRTTVKTISGTTITFELLIHFKDGTEQSNVWDIDVDTGKGFPFYFISADLTAGYTTYAGGIRYSAGPKINETIFVEYLGISRETNHLNLTRFSEDLAGNYKESNNFYWDKKTGVHTEFSFQQSFLAGTSGYLTAEFISYRIIATNLWRVPPPAVVSSTVNIDPGTLNLRSKGMWITAYIHLPLGYNASDINATTILLNGTIAPFLESEYGFVTNSSEYLVDHNNDGILERMVKFYRVTVESWIYDTQGISYGNVALTITGKLLDGTPFEGTDIIFVNHPGDANHDGKIDIVDVALVSAHWTGPPAGLLSYDANCDFNEDGVIDILDLAIINGNWGDRQFHETI